MRTGTFSLFRVHLPCGTVISSQRNLNPVCQSHNINRINTADYVKKGRLFLLVKKFYGILLLTNHAVPLSEILFLRNSSRLSSSFLFTLILASGNSKEIPSRKILPFSSINFVICVSTLFPNTSGF